MKDLTKWAVIDKAPLTASGEDDIRATAGTKKEAQKVAAALGMRVTGRAAMYAVVRKP